MDTKLLNQSSVNQALILKTVKFKFKFVTFPPCKTEVEESQQRKIKRL